MERILLNYFLTYYFVFFDSSKEKVNMEEWHRATISRTGREGQLQVDNSSIIRGYSGPSLSELNLELPFYIGSIVSFREVHRLAGISKGFRGAIQKIMLNGHPLPISVHLQACTYAPVNISGCSYQVSIFDGLPCPITKNPCLNHGLCIPHFNDFFCECSPGYHGKYCETCKFSIAVYKLVTLFCNLNFQQKRKELPSN